MCVDEYVIMDGIPTILDYISLFKNIRQPNILPYISYWFDLENNTLAHLNI